MLSYFYSLKPNGNLIFRENKVLIKYINLKLIHFIKIMVKLKLPYIKAK